MLFKHVNIDLIIAGRKTQTRRVCRVGEELQRDYATRDGYTTAVISANGRAKWAVGRTYAVQPERGSPGVWWGYRFDGRPVRSHPENRWVNDQKPLRIVITDIRQERLQDISKDDVVAEGVGAYTFAAGILSENPPDPRWKFIELWDSINTRAGQRWADNPLVWALTFEVVRE